MKSIKKLPKLDIHSARKITTFLLFVSLTFSAGYFFGFKGYKIAVNKASKVTINRDLPPDKQSVDFSFFWRVWDEVSSNYFDKSKIKPADMVYGAISGMVSALGDPYTVFLPPHENKVVQEDLSGSFEGIGIQIGFKGNQLAVIAPLSGSPAEKAGIKPGDFIVGIKDEAKKIDRETVGINLPEAVQAIRGKAGTKVTLTLLREGGDKAIVVEVMREKIDVPSVTLSFVGSNESVAHIQLTKFASETNGEWTKTVKKILDKSNTVGIILDLRNNPGGYLETSVDIASEFIGSGNTVVVEERSNTPKKEYKVKRIGKLLDKKIVVLINGGSASASEILAGALRDDLKTKLVGETSFGKGTVQEPEEFENGSGLHITIAKWLTPLGTWVNEKGLEPDVKIKDNPDTKEDEQLQKAIELLNSQ